VYWVELGLQTNEVALSYNCQIVEMQLWHAKTMGRAAPCLPGWERAGRMLGAVETGASESGPMRRRLSVDARRTEIIEIAQEMIGTEGPRSLSLRSLARRCGMSAPGLMHHFPDLKSLLEAVLRDREEKDQAAILASALATAGPDLTLVSLLDAAARYYADKGEVTRNFDALEAEARNPDHPAHGHFSGQSQRAMDTFRPLIERDYENPEQVEAVAEVLFDGVRARWMMHPERCDLWADWSLVRDSVLQSFAKKRQPE